jgi:hypothetical protein
MRAELKEMRHSLTCVFNPNARFELPVSLALNGPSRSSSRRSGAPSGAT